MNDLVLIDHPLLFTVTQELLIVEVSNYQVRVLTISQVDNLSVGPYQIVLLSPGESDPFLNFKCEGLVTFDTLVMLLILDLALQDQICLLDVDYVRHRADSPRDVIRFFLDVGIHIVC